MWGQKFRLAGGSSVEYISTSEVIHVRPSFSGVLVQCFVLHRFLQAAVIGLCVCRCNALLCISPQLAVSAIKAVQSVASQDWDRPHHARSYTVTRGALKTQTPPSLSRIEPSSSLPRDAMRGSHELHRCAPWQRHRVDGWLQCSG